MPSALMATVSRVADRGNGHNQPHQDPRQSGLIAFYCRNFEYCSARAIGPTGQCGTTRASLSTCPRFGSFYIDADGPKAP